MLSEISIPRWLGIQSADETVNLNLFYDSNQKGSGTCVYTRVETNSWVRLSSIHARSRVVPSKTHIDSPLRTSSMLYRLSTVVLDNQCS